MKKLKLVDFLKEDEQQIAQQQQTNPGIKNPRKNVQKQNVISGNQQKLQQQFQLSPQEIQGLLNPNNFVLLTDQPQLGKVMIVLQDAQLMAKLKRFDPDGIAKLGQNLQAQFPAEIKQGILTALKNKVSTGSQFNINQTVENMAGRINELFGGFHFGPIQSEKQEVSQVQQQMPGIKQAQQKNFERHGAGPDPFAEFEEEDEIQEQLKLENFLKR